MKKTLVLSALTLAVLAGCSNSNQTAQSTAKPALAPLSELAVSPNDQRGYRTLKLDNNLEVILVSDPSTDKSAAALNVGVGLLQDPMTQQGMAHYLEHLLFLGTEKYPDTNEYKEFLSQNGGMSNASTWMTYTNYMFKVNNDAYDEALSRFSDFFKSPKLYPEYTEKEKSAVNAEWSMRRELDFFGQFKLSRQMMGEHPANRFLIGNLETLGDKPGSKLHTETVAFYDKYYSANIMKVALISNLPLDEMEKLARQHFSTIKDKQIDKPAVTEAMNFADVGGKKVFYKPNEDVKQLKLDFTIRNNMDEFMYKPNGFVTYLLGSEMPGTPAQLLKEKGWISALYASSSPNHYGNYGELSITMDLTDEGMKHRDEALALVVQYIDLVKQQGVDEKYFKEIKTSLDNEFRFLPKVEEFRYAATLVNTMQNYPTNYAINANYYYGQFNSDAVDEVLQQLTPETLRVWYISKDEKVSDKQHFYAGEYRIEDIPQSQIDSWKGINTALVLPQVNRMMPESFALKTQGMEQARPELKVEKEGVKVWHYPSQQFSQQPKGVLIVDLNAGVATEQIENQVALDLWQDLYGLQQSQLTAEASAAGMNATPIVGQGMTLQITGFTDKQPLLLEEMLKLQPNVDQTSFEQAKDRYVRGLANKQKQFAIYQVFPAVRKLTQQHQFEDTALSAAAQKMTLADFNNRVSGLIKQNQPRILAFGNYDNAELELVAKEVANALGGDHQQTDYVKVTDIMPEPGQVLSYQQDTAAADIALADLAVHAKPGVQQKAIAKVLAAHFRHEAFNQLRTEEQLAYAVGALDYPMDDYAAVGLYIQSPVMDLPQAQERFDRFKQEYQGKLEKLSEQEFAAIKNGVLVGLKEAPKNMFEEVRPLMQDWYDEEWQYDSKDKMIAAVEAVSLDDIKAFYAQTMLNPDAARINVQLRGSKYQDKPFARLPNQMKVTDVAELKGKLKYQL